MPDEPTRSKHDFDERHTYAFERGLSRRQLLARGARLGAGLPLGAWLLAACGGGGGGGGGSTSAGGPTAIQGTAVMQNYVGWMGKHEVAGFRKRYPNANVKQVPSGNTSLIAIVKRTPGALDFALQDQYDDGPLTTAGLTVEPDWSRIPNIKNIPDAFRKGFPHGIPTDYGKTGIAYRTDIVKEDIKGWHDVWRLAPKYSGQVVFIDLIQDSFSSALKYLGYSGSSSDPSQIDAAKNALIQIKPHLEAFKDSGIADGLIKGTTAIAMDWDYDIAAAQAKNPKIKWVVPEEGIMAYLEGWIALKGAKHLDATWAFWNFALEPKSYADFVNTTGTAYLMPAATPFVDKSISGNALLRPDPAVLTQVEFEQYPGPDGVQLWNKAWDEVKSA